MRHLEKAGAYRQKKSHGVRSGLIGDQRFSMILCQIYFPPNFPSISILSTNALLIWKPSHWNTMNCFFHSVSFCLKHVALRNRLNFIKKRINQFIGFKMPQHTCLKRILISMLCYKIRVFLGPPSTILITYIIWLKDPKNLIWEVSIFFI